MPPMSGMLAASSALFFSIFSSYIFFSPSFLLKKVFFGVFLSFLNAIRYNDIVEEGSGFYLPDFESHVRASVPAYLVHVFVVLVVGIIDLGVHPWALVVWVVDHLRLPLAAVIRVVDQRGLPFTVVLVIPVFRLLGVRVGDFCRLVVPVVRFFVVGIHHSGILHPVCRLADSGILDGLLAQKVKFFVELSLSHRLVVDQNLEGVVGVNDKCVEVGQVIGFGSDFFLDEVVFVLVEVVQNNVGPLVGRSANIGAKHDGVGSLASEAVGIEFVSAGEEFDVGTAAIQVLFVLHGVLNDQGLVAADEGFVELCGNSVEPSIFRGLDSLVGGITVPFSRGVLPSSHFILGSPFSRFRPSTRPFIVIEILTDIEFCRRGRDHSGSCKG
mmetsp:Transcript_4917/g.11718  ORF Transcript_4917/g.11718 Transcript_4917/m.11718 type:complete len:383 (+) Transcript_4917:1064-2212(+)